MVNLRQCLLTAAAAPLLFTAQASAADNVVASIKPVHSLVSAVMEGVGTPELLVKGAASPHAYSMRPSEAAMLEEADLVFWVGPDLEVFLDDPLHTLTSDANVVALSETPGLTLLEMREGGAFETHDHGHEEHDHGQHEHQHEHEHEHHAHDEHDHDDHAHGETDTHLWLDPENARKMVQRIAEELSKADPGNTAVYAENAAALDSQLESLIAETNDALAGVREKPFVVFHDAYHYYENRFGIAAAGSITVSPDVLPGARRVSEIHERIAELNAACVFSEPQFEPKLISVVTEGTDARSGVLDPLGADIEDGPELYFTLIGSLTASLVECLSSEP